MMASPAAASSAKAGEATAPKRPRNRKPARRSVRIDNFSHDDVTLAIREIYRREGSHGSDRECSTAMSRNHHDDSLLFTGREHRIREANHIGTG